MKNPKLIHRIYFDNFAPFHDPFEHFLASWRREMPDYEIMSWNISNLDVNENDWTRLANKSGAPVFLAEYFRWKVLDEYGGLYLDADCEILDGGRLHSHVEELYSSEQYDVFFGVEERANGHPTAQTVGAKKGAEIVSFMLDLYERRLAPLWEWRERRGLIGPQLMSLFFLNRGLNKSSDGHFVDLDEPTIVARCKVYPQKYFSPKFALNGSELAYDAALTSVYHMFANSNVDFSKNKVLNKIRSKALTFSEYRQSLQESLRFPRHFDADWLSTVTGTNTEGGILGSARPGVFLHGPYTSLPRGRYVATIEMGRVPLSLSLTARVTANRGANQLVERIFEISAGARQLKIPFEVSDDEAGSVEVVLEAQSSEHLLIKGVTFDKRSDRLKASRAPSSLKLIHRIYFGFDSRPDGYKPYLETWRRELPEFKIMEWDATNLPMKTNRWTQQLYVEKDHAFLTDYFRWYLLKTYGGVYLDADVEVYNGEIFASLIEELEEQSEYEALIGIDEKSGGWYTAHSMASKPGSEIARFMCETYDNFGNFAAWRKKGLYFWAPQLTGLYFANKGHNVSGMGTTPDLEQAVVAAGVKILPQDWFSPLSPSGRPAQPFTLNGLTENTCLCHHFACSWHDSSSIYLEHSKTKGGQSNVMLRQIENRLELDFPVSGGKLQTIVGALRDGQFETSETDGYLCFGPYIDLYPGTYEVTISLDHIRNLSDATVDVVAENNSVIILPRRPVALDRSTKACSFRIPIIAPMQGVEFRVHVSPISRFAVKSVSVRKIINRRP